MSTDNRRYFAPRSRTAMSMQPTAEDLHAWSIYRQNINSELTTSALGDNPKGGALPYGNFALRPHQVDAILHRAKRASVGASSELLNSTNAMTYLKFGLPRVSVPNLKSTGTSTPDTTPSKAIRLYGSRGVLTHPEPAFDRNSRLRKSRSEMDIRKASRLGHPVLVNDNPRGNAAGRDHISLPVRSPSEGDINRIDQFRPLHRMPGPSTSEGHYTGSVSYRHSNSKIDTGSFLVAPSKHGGHDGQQVDEHLVTKRNVERKKSFSTNCKAPSKSADYSLIEIESGTISNVQHIGIGQPEPDARYAPYPHSNTDPEREDTSYVSPIMLNEKYFLNGSTSPNRAESKSHTRNLFSTIQPHLQVRSLSLTETESRKAAYSFSSVTFEAKAGDLVGIVSTSDKQGDDFLNALINRRGKWGSSLKGAITYNGVNVDPMQLAHRAVYAGTNLDFNPNMSLKQTVLFASHLAEPGEANRKTDTRGRIEALIGDLGLSNVAATRVGELTCSEKQRLNIACQLLIDPDLVLLDRPTLNMDIFDTFFLVEYLRQWALRGRIVIMTFQPPTFEIFNMLSRVLILSNGCTLYSGKRKDMITYFELLDFPCPTQKNPADYYVDLVSIDQTTKDAHEESIQRINHLASVFSQRQPRLSDLQAQPGILPPKIWKAGFIWQIVVLWIRALIFMFPYNLIDAMYQIVQSVAMSVLIGIVFFGINKNQASADDRMGLLYVLLSIGFWPIVIRIIQKEYNNKRWIYRELENRMYCKGAYLIAKLLYSIPVTAISIGSYVVPVYFMSRLRQDEDFRPFFLYVAMLYLHLLTWRIVAKLAVYLFSSPGWTVSFITIFATLSFLTSGYPVHPNQLSPVFKWFDWISPTQYAFSQLAQMEFHGVDKLECQKIPVQIGGLPILTSPNCGLESGRDAISFLGLSRHFGIALEIWKPFVAVAVIDTVMLFLCAMAFLLVDQRPNTRESYTY
ncbi:ATP-binding cassette sub-family G member 8-like [Paramacrobiotus metropolitanus]|uniref:ATP-binding cassette sub-family G member 8-like n=1 Tax=Paramacrobiotus metropolitanus TaxID=2943436 RepID=UPI0024462A94|nr:ATP-binding cassette sub-family G member 8-like [Paramacrobiotus metropolitanus]XP_055353321.1 ATP-binding cassette sub-family G member 8-like [Paramacrobiotus metropolitanus]XP_055353322.1 ATP-binding cassette sub-family G member 8-like [Paramacrobiotus metropolitanus]